MTDVRVEYVGDRASLVSRFLDGVCVWGQAFSRGGAQEEHVAQVGEVVERIYANPERFRRWWL